jgi:hypothetical protein
VHALGRQRDVQPGIGDRDEVAQLGQGHGGIGGNGPPQRYIGFIGWKDGLYNHFS